MIIFSRLVSNDSNPLYSGNPLMGTLSCSEDLDKMQHNATFHQESALFAKTKTTSRDRTR